MGMQKKKKVSKMKTSDKKAKPASKASAKPAAVKKAVEKLRGEITVISSVNHGSLFSVRLSGKQI